MSFADDITNKGLSSVGGGSPMVTAVMEMLQNHPGGLSGILQLFEEKGLGNLISSWISTGQNLPISGDQIRSVLANDQLTAFASKLGISPEVASGKLAEFLPDVVNQLTPNGKIEQAGLLEKGMDMLKALGRTGTTG